MWVFVIVLSDKSAAGAVGLRSESRVKFSGVQQQLSESSLASTPPVAATAAAAAAALHYELDEQSEQHAVSPPKHITFDGDDDENDDSEYNMTELSPTHVQRYIWQTVSLFYSVFNCCETMQHS